MKSSIVHILFILLLMPDPTVGDARAQNVKLICGTQPEHNSTAYVPNFVATMETISVEIRNSGFGTAMSGSGFDTNYGLAQCYNDLTLLDCVLCYAEARTVLPQCFPYTGGRIYLDGCFMRAENYSFYEEFQGPEDRNVCGNVTRKGSGFQEAARRAVMGAVSSALGNNGQGRARVGVSGAGNESAYVLTDCWKTVNASGCKACLEKASKSVLECLPWSEGRALNTGCFMRYSDRDFLNAEASKDKSSSRGYANTSPTLARIFTTPSSLITTSFILGLLSLILNTFIFMSTNI